ncbi:TonB-dependent receptor [Catalinimonas alkaloidigena]|uniref:TonB-dependent receptor n=1 Tax=Catalinimonas alkaloidigena TaxID=1075417 RepID=A0A1G9P1L9_9BACT|nr:TonB-dependent receptor [Catalinimonas alkaloidigena]SDL92574.1 TonB-dependent receptor [Catalinimonas alkaloidigena]
MKRSLLTLFLLLAGTLPLWAQTGALSGRVTDELGLAMPGATLLVTDLQRGTATNNQGEFTLVNLPAGTHTVRLSYIGYAPTETFVTIAEGTTTQLNLSLEPGVTQGQEVVVLGDRLKGQAKALNQQRSNLNVTNIVAADQIGRFPDANIGDAMKRIPGITVQYDQGEARFGIIRGTSPQLNSVMINGERVPSAEAEIRSVQLDLVPADMIQTIEVNKTVTPDMDADAIGGSVNLVTRSAPEGLRISGTAGTGYNFLSEKPLTTGALVLGNRYFNNKLGVVLSGSYYNHRLGSDDLEAEWDYDDDPNQAWVSTVEVRKYSVQRVRRSLSTTLDYTFSPNHKLLFRGMYNWRDDRESRYRLNYVLEDALNGGRPGPEGLVPGEATEIEDGEEETYATEVQIQTKGGPDNDRARNRRLEDQRAQSYQLRGEHLLGNKVSLTWQGNYAIASEMRPQERYIGWNLEGADLRVNLADPRQPQVGFVHPEDYQPGEFSLDELTEENQFTTDEDLNGRVDLRIPLQLSGNTGTVQLGGRLRHKSKVRRNTFSEYEPLDEDAWANMGQHPTAVQTDPDFLAGPYAAGFFTPNGYLGTLRLDDAGQFESDDLLDEYVSGNFNAREVITAGYLMWQQQLSEKFSFLTGVRLENTNLDYTGNELTLDEEGEYDGVRQIDNSDQYLNVLPALHLRFDATDHTVLRAAWTNTLARPNYYDLVPYREVNLEDNELAIGNPALQPTVSMNFDLMAEHYFSSVGVLSGGFFYKDLENFIFNYQRDDVYDPVTDREFDDFSQPLNGGSASLWGVELAAQRQLDFLPGALRGLGVYANYTFTQSAVDGLPIEGRENEALPLAGTANHTLNGSLSFESARLVLRLSLNYTSDYIDEYGDEAFYDRYYDQQVFLDFNGSYAFTPQWRLFVEANNLTNQPLRYFQGIADRTMQAEYYNVRVTAGVKFDLFQK